MDPGPVASRAPPQQVTQHGPVDLQGGSDPEQKIKVSCSSCRARKVMCRTSTPDIKVCDQCKRHGLECIYLEHRRGRKLGSRNKPRGLSDDSGSPPAPIAESSRIAFTTLSRPSQQHTVENSSKSRQLTSSIYLPAAPVNNAQPGNSYAPTSIRVLAPPDYSPAVVAGEVKEWRALSPRQGLPEQSPLALLARTAEAQSNNYVAPNPQHPPRSAASTALSSRWSTRNRYESKLDVDPQADPINMGICSLDTAQSLFAIFWDKMANYTGFLDRRIHTLDHVRRHSILLTTVILHTAARHTSTQALPEAARIASALDRHIYSNLWPRILLGNYKSVYICQACMVWASFVAEPKPGEDDLGWSLFGHAIRVAMEIGLNITPPPTVRNSEHPALFARNCERTWLTCFIADRSWATQLGRPPLIADGSWTMNLEQWLNDKAVATLEDGSIVALIELRRIMTSPTTTHAERMYIVGALEEWRHNWICEATKASYRIGHLGQVYYHYANIVLRLQWMASGDISHRTNEKVAIDHAGSLLRCVATELPLDVFLYGHNNAFTMISMSVAILIQSQVSEPSYAPSIDAILKRLRECLSRTPQAESVKRWHESFFEKALEKVVSPGTLDIDILRMLNETIPGDLMDMISWDLPSLPEWGNMEGF